LPTTQLQQLAWRHAYAVTAFWL